jgi:hypothetical protein
MTRDPPPPIRTPKYVLLYSILYCGIVEATGNHFVILLCTPVRIFLLLLHYYMSPSVSPVLPKLLKEQLGHFIVQLGHFIAQLGYILVQPGVSLATV